MVPRLKVSSLYRVLGVNSMYPSIMQKISNQINRKLIDRFGLVLVLESCPTQPLRQLEQTSLNLWYFKKVDIKENTTYSCAVPCASR